MSALLEVEHLAVKLPVEKRLQPVLHDVSFSLERGEVLALVGESGSGKSMTARSIMQLLPPGAKAQGRISFDGTDLLSLRPAQMRAFRAAHLGMIFQDPRAAINPVRRLGDFLTEALVINQRMDKSEALERATKVLEEVGIDSPARRLRQYPHELSGGMLQRMMIASVLLTEPELILADEPTTALDVTIQAEVVAILDELRRDRGMAMVFITHDLELAAAVSNRIAVMYAGYIVETSTPAQLRRRPHHPYTAALLTSRPDLGHRMARIPQIPGRPLSAFEAPAGCPFQSRCVHVRDVCSTEVPPLQPVEDSLLRCARSGELATAEVLASAQSDERVHAGSLSELGERS